MSESTQKFLIVNLTRLGDILQSVPLLRALKRKYPGSKIHYLAVTGFTEVCRLIPEIDQVIPFDFNSAVAVSKCAISSLPRRLAEIEVFLDERRREFYDRVYNLSHSRISALLCHLLNVPDTRGLTLDREGYRQITHPWARYFFTANLNRAYNRINLVDVHLGLAADNPPGHHDQEVIWGAATGEDSTLGLPPEAWEKAERLLTRKKDEQSAFLIGFQPGASLPAKRWPVDSFAVLGNLLQNVSGAQVVIFGSKAERSLGQKLSELLGDSSLNVVGQTDLLTLAALLSHLSLLVTNDTGTQHLAAALGVPVLSLCFGSAYPHETGPYGRGHLVVEPDIPCFPCSFHVHCTRYRCQEQVKPDDIFRVIQAHLKGKDHKLDVGVEALLPSAPDTSYTGFHLWKTDFDELGFWSLRPAAPRALTPDLLLNLVNRRLWQDILLQRSSEVTLASSNDPLLQQVADYHLSQNLSCSSPPDTSFDLEMQSGKDAFMRLEALAQQGEELCLELLRLAQPGTVDFEGLQSLSEELARIDKDIGLLGSRVQPVYHLVLDFNFGKQNLEGCEIGHLAHQTRSLYQRLQQTAGRFLEYLQNWDTIIQSSDRNFIFKRDSATGEKRRLRRSKIGEQILSRSGLHHAVPDEEGAESLNDKPEAPPP